MNQSNHQQDNVQEKTFTVSRQSAWLIGVTAIILYIMKFCSLQSDADVWSQVQSVSFQLQNHTDTIAIKVSELPAKYYIALLDAFDHDGYYVVNVANDTDHHKKPGTECTVTIADGYMKKIDTRIACTNILTHKSSAVFSLIGNDGEYVDKIFLGVYDAFAETQDDVTTEQQM